ncbi:hypothetical protein KI387_044529, partial [Taxus chinensis]
MSSTPKAGVSGFGYCHSVERCPTGVGGYPGDPVRHSIRTSDWGRGTGCGLTGIGGQFLGT